MSAAARPGKRIFDILIAAVLLVLLTPLLVLIAVLAKADGGPALFGQTRIGRDGRDYTIWKFRTMVLGAQSRGASVTTSRDRRVTRVGRWLRRSKLDELPQLFNVLVGDMSLVGPRPEVPSYVALWPEHDKVRLLSQRPGITDLASLCYRDEERILSALGGAAAYPTEIMPHKIKLGLAYLRRQSFCLDCRILLATAGMVVGVPATPIVPELRGAVRRMQRRVAAAKPVRHTPDAGEDSA